MIPTQKKGKVLPWRGRSNLTNLDKDVKRPIDQWQKQRIHGLQLGHGLQKDPEFFESTDT